MLFGKVGRKAQVGFLDGTVYEAQRLMLVEKEDAAIAALAVGYESPMQFNREYKRQFGAPPHRHVSRIR